MALFSYYLLPKKTVVLIMCSMRSGSTLLKALLAEAHDVSNLPEIDFRQFLSHKYRLYNQAYYLSKKRIVVLKFPHPFLGARDKQFIQQTDRMKIIVLVRDVPGVVKSLEKMPKEAKFNFMGKKEYLNYWCDVYESILDSVRLMKRKIYFVRYEDLIKNPKAVTKEIFSFIGSEKQEGAETYHKPKNFEWGWGHDDGGEEIKKLRVLPDGDRIDEVDSELEAMIAGSSRVSYLREKFGYGAPVTSKAGR